MRFNASVGGVRQRSLLGLLVLLALLAALPLPSVSGLKMNIPAGEAMLLDELIPVAHMVTFQFHFPSDSNPVPVTVMQGKEALQSWSDTPDGIITVVAEKTPVLLHVHIDNTGASFSSTDINFYFRPSPDFSSVGTEEQLDPMEKKVRALSASMQRLQALQVNLRIEQKNHRSTVEDANDRVLTWSIFQVLALLSMSGFNFIFLKRFLERKSFF